MITVARRGSALAGLAVAGALLAGCGSNAATVAVPRAAPTLPPPPATIPADYTSLGAILAPLQGVAQCTDNGPASAVCSLVTTTTNTSQISIIRPFEVKVFTTTAAASAYVTLIRQTNATRTSAGSAPREALVGPNWVVVPQTTTSDLTATLQRYLGGTLVH